MSQLRILFVVPKLPKRRGEVAYSFIREEIDALEGSNQIKSLTLSVDYKNAQKTLVQLPEFIRQYNTIDLIHAHFVVPYGFIGSVIAEIYRKPLIITVHGFDILVNKQLGYGLNRFGFFRLLTKFALHKSCKIIANSTTLKDECLKYGVSSSKISVIPLGVNLDVFKPISQNDLEKLISDELKQTCIEKDSINILCPKRMEKIYGIEYLLKAVKILIERKVKSFRLILIKWGTQTKHYRSLISQFNLSNNVIFLKPISRTAMPLLYNVSDFTVVPSLVEGFGLTVAESLACGRPVIGTAIGGILDQIVDGYNGFLVDPRSALNLADRMQILIEDDHLRKEMSVKAREFAESRLDLKNRVTNIIRLYKKIAE